MNWGITETSIEVALLITAVLALCLLLIARGGRAGVVAIITLYICIGLNLAEILLRRYMRMQSTVESATLETVTIVIVATALYYSVRSRKEGNKASGKLGFAILCMVWAVVIFGLEVLLGFILRKWGVV